MGSQTFEYGLQRWIGVEWRIFGSCNPTHPPWVVVMISTRMLGGFFLLSSSPRASAHPIDASIFNFECNPFPGPAWSILPALIAPISTFAPIYILSGAPAPRPVLMTPPALKLFQFQFTWIRRSNQEAGSWEKKIGREKRILCCSSLCFVVRRSVLEGATVLKWPLGAARHQDGQKLSVVDGGCIDVVI